MAGAGQLVAVGPPIDLMGFAIAPDRTYLASGHPAPDSDLPQPIGLIQSTDQGRTWSLRSRGGQSDVHALTALGPGVMAFDDALRFSPDRVDWQDRQVPSPPRDLAAGPEGTVLATTEPGLLASADRGRTWQTVSTPQLLVTAAWAGPRTSVGASTTGVLMVSRDAGATWSVGPRSVGDRLGGHRDPARCLPARAPPGGRHAGAAHRRPGCPNPDPRLAPTPLTPPPGPTASAERPRRRAPSVTQLLSRRPRGGL